MTPVDLPKLPSELRNRPPIYSSNDGYKTIVEEEPSIFIENLHKINELKNVYSFTDTIVKKYIQNNLFIADSLIIANTKIKEIFNQNIVAVNLEIVEDYEEDYEQLFIIIKSSAKAKELVNLLSQLQDQWYLDLPYEIRSKFAIALKSV